MTVGPDMAGIAAVIAATMACWALVPSGGGSAHTAQVRVFELSELRLLSAQAPAGEKPAGSPPQLLSRPVVSWQITLSRVPECTVAPTG